MKKALKVFGIFLGLLVAAAIIIPLVVDVDKYRPEIVKVANEHINGKLELGKLKLSLWGRVLIKVDGIRLSDSRGKPILSVSDAFFHLPFLSLLTGSPSITLNLDQPEVHVIKDAKGDLNVMKLVKTSGETEGSAGGGQSAPNAGGEKSSSGSVQLPAIVARARLGLQLKKALLKYEDLGSHASYELKDLNFSLKGASLSHESEFELSSVLDSKVGSQMEVHGPFHIEGKLEPRVVDQTFRSLKGEMEGDFSKLAITLPGTFTKPDGMKADFEIAFEYSPELMKLSKGELHFHNLEIKSTANVVQNADKKSQQVDFSLQSNEVDLSSWGKLIVPLQPYDLKGTMKLSGHAKGTSENLQYAGKFEVSNLTLSSSQLKAKPTIQVLVSVATDQLEQVLLTVNAPGNDLKLIGNMKSFTAPRFHFSLVSNHFNMDDMFVLPDPAAAPASGGGGGESSVGGDGVGGKGGSTPPAEDTDLKLAESKKNPIMRNASGDFDAVFKQLQIYGIAITNWKTKLTLDRLKMKTDMSLGIWTGTVTKKASVDLAPERPTYQFSTKIDHLDLKKAVTSQLALFKNTVYGMLYFQMSGSGSSFNTELLKKRLNAKGSFHVDDAVFTSIDVAKMASEALNNSINKIAEKYPQLKGKKVPGIGGRETRYEKIQSDIQISDGIFRAPNFSAVALPKQGVNLEGNTEVGMIDQKINAKWKVIDRDDLTKAKDLNVNVAGTEIPHVLASGNPPVVSFPVTVKGTLANPQYSYEEVPEYLTKVAVQNATGAAKSRVQKEVKQKVMDQIQQKAPDDIKKALKKFGF